MPVVSNGTSPTFAIPGIDHQTVAGARNGMKTMEVWLQTIHPHSGTPWHRHACEEVIVVLSGSGRCTIDGVSSEFGPNSTLILPSDSIHMIENTSDEPMRIVAALAAAPVKVRTPEGAAMALPWYAEGKPAA